MPASSPKQLRQLQRRAQKSGFEPGAVLRCTERAANAALLIQERCHACHGRTVKEVLGSMASTGARYGMADLRYDIKHGRLEVLPPGSRAGAAPSGRARRSAPCAGQPLPPASLDEFFQFLQCQLRMEMRQHVKVDLALSDKEAERLWPDVEAFITPNLGNTERWVPYHHVVGPHELFLVQHVHSNKAWDERQRFLAMFVFRAHCKRDLFATVQAPLMAKKEFWRDPIGAFCPGGMMEKAILSYRKETGRPLITNCFRIIPPRVLSNNDANLVRSITSRTQELLKVAERTFPVMKDKGMSALEKLAVISREMQEAQGCGETWAKMLTVCIDVAYPKEQLLEVQCDVGAGALPALRCLLAGGHADKKQALLQLLQAVNGSKSSSAKGFWALLRQQEAALRTTYKAFPLVLAQAATGARAMSAVTLQVQLCEYRQFRHALARSRYGLPEDESMRGEPERATRLLPENFVEFDAKRKCIGFRFPREEGTVDVEVPIKATGNHRMVATRVAHMCFLKLVQGATREEALRARDELLASYRPGGAEAPEGSEAWEVCRAHGNKGVAVVAFEMHAKDGSRFCFQTTALAAGGVLEAERVARLCWVRLNAGSKKEAVIAYRNELYKESAARAGRGVGGGATVAAATPTKRPAAAATLTPAKGKAEAPPARTAGSALRPFRSLGGDPKARMTRRKLR